VSGDPVETGEFVLLPAGHRLLMWKRARARISELEQEKRQHDDRLKWIASETDYQQALVKACEPWVCKACNGQGYRVEWIDQDTKTHHKCADCNSKGCVSDPLGLIGKIGALEGESRA